MKKYLCTLLVTAFISLNAFSQVEIDNSNNVGIGIATPTQKLDINGQLRVRNIPVNNALDEVLVKDINGVVYYRDLETVAYWTKFGDSLYSDSLCFVGIGTASPLAPLHIVGTSRTQIGNSLLDISPIPGPTFGIGGGVDLIFNKLNVCVGLFRWEEKSLPPPFPPLTPDPVFKFFPRTTLSPTAAPGLEIATFGNSGLGLEGLRLMLCPSIGGPFPLWDNPRIDLQIANRIDINPGGPAGSLVVSNIGSSGIDGVSMALVDSIKTEIISLDMVSSGPLPIVRHGTNELMTQYEYDVVSRLIRFVRIDTSIGSTATPHRYTYDGLNNRIIENIPPERSFVNDELTTIYVYDGLDRVIRTTNRDGSIGSTATPYVRDYDALNNRILETGPPLRSYRHDSLTTTYEYDPLNRLIRRDYLDLSSGSTATPHTYTYDGLNNRIIESIPPERRFVNDSLTTIYTYDNLDRIIRTINVDGSSGSTATPYVRDYDALNNRVEESGPPETSYTHDSLRTSYTYDPLGRRIISRYEDLSTSTTAQPLQYEYDAISRIVRTTGPRTLEYTHNSDLRRTSIYEPTTRSITETWDGLLPSEQPQTMEFDFIANQMRLLAGLVLVNGNFDVTGIVGGAVKAFKIDHPLDPHNKNLMHVSVESPDMMNIYNGNVITDKDGNAIVEMPDYFSALNMDFRYQLTTIGQQAQAWIAEEMNGNTFKISTDKPNVKVSWLVTGIRQDTYAKENRVQVEVDKEDAMIGKLLYEPKKELGLNK